MRQRARVLDLTESNPTRAKLDYPAKRILEAAHDEAVLDYAPDPKGSLKARETVAGYYAARGVTVDPSHILLTASTSEAYAYLFKLLTEPGDEVLVPRPSYPLFEYLAAMESVCVRQYPLRHDGQWHIDFASLEEGAGPRTRAIVVVNPNNPTGSFLKRNEWQRLQAFASKNNLAILSDEVFSDYLLADGPAIVPSLAGLDSPVLTFAMSGLSKVCGLPQMKLGWVVASGPKCDDALRGLEWIADTFLSVSTPVQVALPGLLEAGIDVREQIGRRIRANLGFLHNTFGRNSACRILNVEGGWNATMQVPRTRSEEEWALNLLQDHDVRVQPGFFYDFESEAFLVLSLLTEPAVFEEGVRRIVRVMG